MLRRMKHSRLFTSSALALGIAAAAPVIAAAQAPPPAPAPSTTVPPTASASLDRTCYAPGDPMVQTGHGFGPNAQVLQIAGFSAGGDVLRALSATITTDAAGNFRTVFRTPQLARARDRTEDAVSLFTDPAALDNPSATPPGPVVEWTLSGRDVKVAQWTSGTANPTGSMTVDAFGWTRGHANLYAHYYRGTKRIRSVKLGPLTGACGTLKRRVKQFPFKGVKAGEWRVFFSDTAVLDKTKDPFVRRTVRVSKAKATA
jgi:hypothetical protein